MPGKLTRCVCAVGKARVAGAVSDSRHRLEFWSRSLALCRRRTGCKSGWRGTLSARPTLPEPDAGQVSPGRELVQVPVEIDLCREQPRAPARDVGPFADRNPGQVRTAVRSSRQRSELETGQEYADADQERFPRRLVRRRQGQERPPVRGLYLGSGLGRRESGVSVPVLEVSFHPARFSRRRLTLDAAQVHLQHAGVEQRQARVLAGTDPAVL